MVKLLALVAVAASVASTSAASCAPESCTAAAQKLLCGSDGVTYTSACELELAQCSHPTLQLASVGACAAQAQTPATPVSPECETVKCGDHANPICASNGVTYQNACDFDRAYCKNKELAPVSYGACETSATVTTRRLRR
uniref:Kazal-like domain-containing protein n=1 Tax=Globisporangium ultimum (strain ATCC 200006 / CBS 805.95 / DAOM BR144) TaxID=431595 RepID=K3X4L2_GLOUD